MPKQLFYFLIILFLASCQSKQDGNGRIDVAHESVSTNYDFSEFNNYAKQIILACDEDDLQNFDSLVSWVHDFEPGGIWFKNWPIEAIQRLTRKLDTLMPVKPLFFTDYFDQIQAKPYPIWSANINFRASKFWHCFLASGINAVILPGNLLQKRKSRQYFNQKEVLEHIVPSFRVNLKNRKLESYVALTQALQNSTGFLWLDSLKIDSLPYHEIRRITNLKGLIIANPTGNHLSHLRAGADMVVISNRSLVDFKKYIQNQSSVRSYRQIISYSNQLKDTTYYRLSSEALLKATQLHYIAKSSAILNKSRHFFPLKKYRETSLEKILKHKAATREQIFIVPEKLSDSLLKLIKDSPQIDKTLFLFSAPSQYQSLSALPNLMFYQSAGSLANAILGAQTIGKLSVTGNMVEGKQLIKGKSMKGRGLTALPPEFVFINGKILGKVGALVNEAIRGKAFPGCQVLAIKDGVIIFNKAFGHTDYSRKTAINQQHLYDLASLTKVLATTLVAMKLWEDGYFKLEEPVGKYLPDSLRNYIPNGSTLRGITFQELLVHRSGLPAGFPVIKYMRKAADLENRFYNGFCDYPYENFQTEVAKDLYLENSFQDSMWLKLNTLWVDSTKEYKYSDVNMNALYFVLKRIIDEKKLVDSEVSNTFETYLYKNFYERLNMSVIRYQPLKKFSENRIVPTENDRFWRKQLLQGHVHDPNAALYGGIAGNAGLFSNATDIGVLLSMWQNNGVFEGKRYLKAETIQKFCQAQPNSHRGLGFNKRTITNSAYSMAASADQSSYGHTGFTGTCFWVDPVSKISYVFLSNRVHPKVSRKIYEFNIRANVHQVFYEAMLK